jgi:hypothetical protein
MSFRLPTLCFFIFIQFGIFAQEFQWKANLNYFFDNNEFAKSTITKDQTMNGVRFSPEFGLSWDTSHSFYAGADLLKISGSQKTIDKVDLIAYYQYHTQKTNFQAGAFPRNKLLSNYSDLFFQDSIQYFHPVMEGIFWQLNSKNAFFNIWLDWNGHQTALNRETFYVGSSAHKSFGNLFVDFQSYMYHFANTRPSNPTYHVCDNALAHISLGVDYSNKQGLDTLLFAIGVLGGYERERGLYDNINTPIGALLRFNIEYRGFGANNSFYIGKPRLVLYDKYGGNLYWSNPFLQSNSYFESKVYINVIKTCDVIAKIGSNFHFSEGKIMFEQLFTLGLSIDRNSKFQK